MVKTPVGWIRESARHGASARGVKTGRKPKGPTRAKVLKRFASKSSPRMYEVRTAADGITYCTCPGWRFQKAAKEDRACGHMKSMGLRGDSMMLRV